MFDIGGWEFLIIVVVAIVIIGPKDLPGMIRSVGGWIRKARELASEFQSGIDDLAQEVDLEKIGEEFRDGVGLKETNNIGDKIREEIANSIDSSGEVVGTYESTKEIIEDNLAIVQRGTEHQNQLGDSNKQNTALLKGSSKKSSDDEA